MTGSARDAILQRVRDALRDAMEPPAEIERNYRRHDDRDRATLLDLFAERAGDYGARVRRCSREEAGAQVTRICSELGLSRVVVPRDLPQAWRPDGVAVAEDDPAQPGRALDDFDGVISGCALAIAETGTFVLDGGPAQGRRAITLVPDHHICIVEAAHVVGLVPEALARLAATGANRRPITFVSGPSASSDIELNRVEGVHGPRHLAIVLVADNAL